MISITGYKILKKLYYGLQTVVYRAQREQDNQPVILKILKAEYPTIEEITQLRHEYEISRNLKLPGTVRPYGLENYQNGLALIMEDLGGEDLKKFIDENDLEIKEFLKLAIQLAGIIAILHKKQIIHKDIKPQNIIINPETRQVKITDFSIASRLTRENATLSNPTLLEGTLAYMSPEQTGRMNRSIDYRTDLYSLGVTFYEILTGSLPFQSIDPLELVHCHIAKQPKPPSLVNPEIPQAVSDIVMKLLSKTAEERYQSAFGLKADLEDCLTQLDATGNISNFTPGQQDFFGQFLIPQKLYGREIEVRTLMDAFERVSAGNTEMMLVSGYSGIGKSSLVNEVHKPIVRQRGYFISGKFDQFKRNIPYVSVIQAFQELMRQLLTESAEKLAAWKKQILDALGENGKIITDVIPEVELIIGQQPDVPQLGATETQNRFNRLFQQFLNVFTKKEHPLVLFLDDLQWADSASLKLIQLLVTDADSEYLLMIGAYRDNEVDATHPLMLTLEEIQKNKAIVNNIILQTLDILHVNQLVADTLHDETQNSKPLAELVFHKTQGNPFFITQLLQTLYQEKLLTYEVTPLELGGRQGRWHWDIEQIQAIGITDYNVVELIARNIQKLPPETQKVLKLAACIGNRFNLDILAIVNEKLQSETATDLWNALQAGLILPLSDSYKIPLLFNREESAALTFDELKVSYQFLHDRVQQAAYSLIQEAQKKETHFKIGQLLLKNTNTEERKENIFALVNQLNFGVDLIPRQEEKEELAQLNLIAGQKAKAATAYEPAVRYLNVGLGLLATDSWQRQYELTLNLYVEAVEAEYLNTNFERAAALATVVLQQASTLLDKVKVYELQIQFYMAQNQMLKAIDTGLEALEKLGVSLSPLPSDGSLVVKLPRLEDLENIPTMSDRYQLAALRLLITVASPAYNAKPEIVPQIILTLVNYCIEYGHSALAAYVYGLYGFFLCAALGDMDAGYHSGQLALKLLDQFNARELKCKIYQFINVFIKPWRKHIRETIAPLLEGLQSGLETGDIESVSYSVVAYCPNLFFIGERLEFVNQQQGQYLDLLMKLKQEYPIYTVQIWRQLTLNLMGESGNKLRLSGDSFDEAKMMPLFINSNNRTLLFVAYFAKTLLFYVFKDYVQALANAKLAAEHAQAMIGGIIFAAHNFYYSLALLAVYPKVGTSEQQEYIKQVEENQQTMQRWAEHSPANFHHKYELIEAEKARVLGHIGVAMEYYERAIEGAKAQGYIQEEALANELAADFYFYRGKPKVAQTYLTDAYYGYIRWGATAKVKNLEETYPHIFSQLLARESTTLEVTRTKSLTTAAGSFALDLATVMKASQALAGEIVLSNLLEKLLKIMMENAGAQNSCLILESNGQLMVEAVGDVAINEVLIGQSLPVEESDYLPISIINYVHRTRTSVVLNDANRESNFTTDRYIIKKKPKSILCTPIINQNKLLGMVYLENNLIPGAFTSDRIELLKLLSSQAAISLENAILYANLEAATEELKEANTQLEDYSRTLEQKVENRTLELKEKNQHLQQTLQELQQAQSQLIQTEKMSSLGQLVAGIAHEINNPVSFIYGNLKHASGYLQNLLRLIEVYQQQYPNPTPDIEAEAETIELDYLREDFPKILNSMQTGAERIRQIVLSLRNFSRLDEAEMKPVDIHEGIENTLLILHHRIQEKIGHSGLQIIKNYGNLPKVECYAGQLNQVFMNILANAIDVLEQNDRNRLFEEIQNRPSTIRIQTELINNEQVRITIADNGSGMTEALRSKVFDPFFTTKPVGSGTGLGLSISYQIVVEKHGGQLRCISAPHQGAAFIIEIPIQQRKKSSRF